MGKMVAIVTKLLHRDVRVEHIEPFTGPVREVGVLDHAALPFTSTRDVVHIFLVGTKITQPFSLRCRV